MPGFEVLLAGRTLADRYRVDAVIGRGAMGAVFRAMDLRLDRAVAVKVVTVEDDGAGEARVRFRREAQAAARIRHPHVVAVHDFGTDAALGLDFLVMELLEGEDLAARIARGPLAPDEVAAVFRQTAAGLEAGHLMGLVHRDVKPGNVFLKRGREVNAVLLDFGVAQMDVDEGATRTHLTRMGRHPLSPAYASPEQIRGDGTLTRASDVFSLGMTVYLAATGRAPYSPTELEQLAVGVPVPLRSPSEAALAPLVADALARSLDPDPAARPADAGELLALLEGRALAPRPVVAPPRGAAPSRVDAAPAPRRAGMERAGLLGLGAVAVGVTWMLAGRPGTQPPAPVPVDSAALARADTLPADTPAVVVTQPPAPEPEPEQTEPESESAEPRPDEELLTVADVDEAPKLRNDNDIRRMLERGYPPFLRDAGVGGTVMLQLVIDSEGRVEEDRIEVVSSDHDTFTEVALRVAPRLRFRPARLRGENVRVLAHLPLTFSPDS
jgi:TonB family protein